MQKDLIVSLHLPKTAGTSFVHALKAHYCDDLLLDYDDLPISKPLHERAQNAVEKSLKICSTGLSGKKCVHGHFLPIKYLLLSTHVKMKFITWMRHPLHRAISHYKYWYSTYDPSSSLPHQKKVVEEKWSIERFCFSNEYRNIYSQYLWGFPIETFEFIGITEYFDEDFFYFMNKWLSSDAVPLRLNTSGPISKVDLGFAKSFEEYHEKDMLLYERALNMRLMRL